MSVYIWVVASLGYLFALRLVVIGISLAYNKALEKTILLLLSGKALFWFALSTIGYGLVLMQ